MTDSPRSDAPPRADAGTGAWLPAPADSPFDAVTDPVHMVDDQGRSWSRVDERHSFPEVVTPACWSLWGDAGDLAVRGALTHLGLDDDDELVTVTPATPAGDRYWAVFLGRPAANVDAWRQVYDRLGAAAVRAGTSLPAARRSLPAALRETRHTTHAWWRSVVDTPPATPSDAALVLAEARERFAAVHLEHVVASLLAGTILGQLAALGAEAGRPLEALAVLEAYTDLEEYTTTLALWDTARGTSTRAALFGEHGFHGPHEAEPRSRSWRQDPALAEPVLTALASVGIEHEPRGPQQARERDRTLVARQIVRALPRRARLEAEAVFRDAEAVLPVRETAKTALGMLVDVVRLAVGVLADDHVAARRLAVPDDAWFLTLDEVVALPSDAPTQVAQRRARHDAYGRSPLPDTWVGTPPLDERPVEAPPVSR